MEIETTVRMVIREVVLLIGNENAEAVQRGDCL